ncbi:phage terminase small subunit [Microbulbifer sp. 2201CG32-9]|uniref:phage terminase small subunit n=1 Tax=Microbulbifer sp. 2201CG32-9 TaxID=3232309 RepID=UPI00345B615D
MTSPAQRHYERTLAAQAATEDSDSHHANAYERMLMQLAEDRRRLKQVQSVERKVALKRQLLPRYHDWIEGTLEGGDGAQDDVLMTALVWHIDTGDYGWALRIADYALAHNLTLPDQYQRDTATVIAEEIAEAALAALNAGQAFDLAVVLTADQLTQQRDMPDQARAKLHKAAGLLLSEENPQAALEHLRRALSLHDRVGVKKDIEKLERALKKTTGGTD